MRRRPNQALQQTGHANDASARHNAHLRVSRLLSWVFGEGDHWMAETSAGGFECGGRGFRLQTATCELDSNGSLSIEATGRGCGLQLVAIPFPDAKSFAELPGRIWEPDEDELAVHADVFAEGGLRVRGNYLWIMRGRVACLSFDEERGVLTVSFRLSVRDGEQGEEDEADGVAHCRAC